MEERGKAMQRVEVGEEPFKRVMYMVDFGRLTQLAEEESKAFENALRILRERLNEYAVKYNLRDLLDVEGGKARELAEAKQPELSEFGGANFGVKALAALMAYREYILGRRNVFGITAGYWLEGADRLGPSTMRRRRRTKKLRRRRWRDWRRWRSWWRRTSAASF